MAKEQERESVDRRGGLRKRERAWAVGSFERERLTRLVVRVSQRNSLLCAMFSFLSASRRQRGVSLS